MKPSKLLQDGARVRPTDYMNCFSSVQKNSTRDLRRLAEKAEKIEKLLSSLGYEITVKKRTPKQAKK